MRFTPRHRLTIGVRMCACVNVHNGDPPVHGKRACVCTCVSMQAFVCVRVCVCACKRLCACMCVHVCVCVCVCVHKRLCTVAVWLPHSFFRNPFQQVPKG